MLYGRVRVGTAAAAAAATAGRHAATARQPWTEAGRANSAAAGRANSAAGPKVATGDDGPAEDLEQE